MAKLNNGREINTISLSVYVQQNLGCTREMRTKKLNSLMNFFLFCDISTVYWQHVYEYFTLLQKLTPTLFAIIKL